MEYISAGFLVTSLGHHYRIHSAEHYSGGTEEKKKKRSGSLTPVVLGRSCFPLSVRTLLSWSLK